MLSANFKPKEQLRHRAVSLRQHGFPVSFQMSEWPKGDFSAWYLQDRSCQKFTETPQPQTGLVVSKHSIVYMNFFTVNDSYRSS